ncbi:MAG: nuclease-related domain-containing protein [Verrucomicrobiota bacterium]
MLDPLLANWPFLVPLLLIGVLFKILASPTFKGWFGEKMINRGLRNLDPTQYQLFHELYLPHPTEAGTTQIDHLVVSPFGIFVIETKNYRGWIFGSEKQREWTQQIYQNKKRFQNPLHQNKLHVKALMQFLDLPEDHFLPVLIFIGNAEFKTEMPNNVLNRGLKHWIKNHTVLLLDPTIVKQVSNRLDELHRNTDRRKAGREHLAALNARHKP